MSAWRHTLYGQCLIALCAVTCYGQWDTNAWPTWEHPRAGRVHALDCYSSVVERCEAVVWGGDTRLQNPTYPSQFRFQKTLLESCKTRLKAAIPYYWAEVVDLQQILNSQTNEPYPFDGSQFITNWTVSAMCAYARIPTNFFDYTPWRCLDGVGPFTNDATVGRPHGWAVSTGGTNYPAGRTNWYTSDYGWDGIRRAVTNLSQRAIVRACTGSSGATNYFESYRGVHLAQGDAITAIVGGETSNSAYSGSTRLNIMSGIDDQTVGTQTTYYARAWIGIGAQTIYAPSNIVPTITTIFRTAGNDAYDYKYETQGNTAFTNAGAWIPFTYYPTMHGWQSINSNYTMEASGYSNQVAYVYRFGPTNIAGLSWYDLDSVEEGTRGFDIVLDDGIYSAHPAQSFILYDYYTSTNGFKYR